MKRLSLYLISQTDNCGWDTYDSAVVAAYSEEEARKIHPGGYTEGRYYSSRAWADTLDAVKVEWIGVAGKDVKPGVIVASFNAG